LLIPSAALALLLSLTLPTLSSTRLQTWPYALGAAAFWLLPVFVALFRLSLGRPQARLGGGIDVGFGVLALAGVVSAACSPLRETLSPALLPFLGAIALPYALLPVLRHPRADLLAASFLYPLILVSALLWLPHTGSRNAQPFGHANTTGAVFAFAACWLAGTAIRAHAPKARAFHIAGSIAASALAASSSSRGAILALAAAATAAAAVLSNPRLRELATSGTWSAVSSESNDQRVAMIRGGFDLAALRPATGWGPGAVPHAFPAVRAALPGVPDNYLQLHNSFAQTAATLGGLGLLALTILVVALTRRAAILTRRAEHAPLFATLACGGVLLLFDHSFSTPAFAVLAALPLAALASEASPPTGSRRRLWLLVPGLAVLAILVPGVTRDLAARATWSSALDSAAEDEAAAYAAKLRRAHQLAPTDPFFIDQLASHLATGHPFRDATTRAPDEAVALLRTAIALNPANESAHYNLGWLLLSAGPANAETCAAHFTSAARSAPARSGVWLGLALARLHASAKESPVPPLAAETLLDPEFAWSPRWRDPELAPHRDRTLEYAAAFLTKQKLAPDFAARLISAGPPAEAASAYRRIRTGHGVLYGHPDGPAPADANIFLKPDLPSEIAATLPPRTYISAALLLDCAGLAP
jgi:tetratricopeptide (TPR) repeat protein